MVNANEWLDQNYPKNQRKEIIELDIVSKDLHGSLDLSDFVNLERLECWNNNLTNLTLPSSLKCLDLFYNGFCRDLSFLKEAINLEYLNLNQNSFYNSLEPLKDMKKLITLWIDETNLNSGLEYLPESLEEFYCNRTKLATELKIYGEPEEDEGNYNHLNLLQLWKQAHPSLVKNVQEITKLENILDNLNLALTNSKIDKENISKGLDIFQLETEEKVRELKKHHQDLYQSYTLQLPRS